MSYTAMPRRWGVMATIMLTNITAFLINTCYFSVAPFAAKFFDVDESEFDLLILVNLLILPPFMLVAVFVAERYGLKVILNFGFRSASKLGFLLQFNTRMGFAANGPFDFDI